MWDWWIILLVILIVTAAVIAYTRVRGGSTPDPETDPSRNYTDERETDRVGGMSAEDREWEAASIQRNRDAEERDTAPPPRS